MRDILKKLAIVIASIVLIFYLLYYNDYIGVPKHLVEKHARSTEKTPDSYKVFKAETEEVVGMLFTDENNEKNTFSIYVNRRGFSWGYFYVGGGSIGEISQSVAKICIRGYDERIYMSMNRQKVSRVEIENGQSVEKIEIDSSEPFIFIMPNRGGKVTMYDAGENIIESIRVDL